MKGKILSVIAICMVITLALCSCSLKHDPATAESFKATAESSGFSVRDLNEDESYPGSKGLIASNSDNIDVFFYIFDSAASANRQFNAAQTVFEEQYSHSTTTSVSMGSYQKYAQNGEMYCVVIACGSTLLYCTAASSAKDTINEFVKNLGY